MVSGLVRKKWGVKAASKVKPYQVPRLAVGDVDATGTPWLISLPAQGWMRGPIADCRTLEEYLFGRVCSGRK